MVFKTEKNMQLGSFLMIGEPQIIYLGEGCIVIIAKTGESDGIVD